jgi:putative heme-binding domain-containing protein
VKWVSDEKLTEFRPRIAEMLKSTTLDPRSFIGLTTALARLDDKPVNDDGLADYFLAKLADASAPIATRIMAMRSLNVNHAKVKTEMLTGLLDVKDDSFRIEVLRALKDRADHGERKAVGLVWGNAKSDKMSSSVRAQAILTLSAMSQDDVTLLLEFAAGTDRVLAKEALRALVGVKLSDKQQLRLTDSTKDKPELTALVTRALGNPLKAKRPDAKETEAWLKFLEGKADPDAGRRIFEHPKLAGCYKCHRVEGRGADIGPDLSLIGRTERKWIVESILQPSAVVAPHFQAWKIETTDARTLTGLLTGTHVDKSVYIDEKGNRFEVMAVEVADIRAAKTSIMPDGLLDKLTDQEIRDLVAYLAARK